MALRKLKPTKEGYAELPPDVPSIFDAAAQNDPAGIDAALEYFDVNATDAAEMTALHHAAINNAMDAAEKLLAEHIDATAKDIYGRNAAWIALEVLGPELGAEMANFLGPKCMDYD